MESYSGLVLGSRTQESYSGFVLGSRTRESYSGVVLGISTLDSHSGVVLGIRTQESYSGVVLRIRTRDSYSEKNGQHSVLFENVFGKEHRHSEKKKQAAFRAVLESIGTTPQALGYKRV